MTDIKFTQYLMPDGRQEPVTIDRPDGIAALAEKIRDKGFAFECEMLRDYQTISLTIADDEGDFEIEIVPNGPQVPEAIDRMIERAVFCLGVSA